MATMGFIQPKLINTSQTGVWPQTRGGLNDFPGASLALLQALAGNSAHFKETAAQSWTAGDFIYLDANGTLAICTVTGGGIMSSPIAGQALAKASGVTARPVQFHKCGYEDTYLMNVYHSTALSSVTTLAQLANNSGLGWGLIRVAGTSSRWAVDIETTTVEDGSIAQARVMIVGYGEFGLNSVGTEVACAIGDTNGLVKVKFIDSIATDGSPKVHTLQL